MIITAQKRIMQQASKTAHDWMQEAADFVENRFSDYPPEAKATLIAGYVQYEHNRSC